MFTNCIYCKRFQNIYKQKTLLQFQLFLCLKFWVNSTDAVDWGSTKCSIYEPVYDTALNLRSKTSKINNIKMKKVFSQHIFAECNKLYFIAFNILSLQQIACYFLNCKLLFFCQNKNPKLIKRQVPNYYIFVHQQICKNLLIDILSFNFILYDSPKLRI